MSKVEIEKNIAFDESKQLAALGWCFRDANFFVQCTKTVEPDWFADPFCRDAYKAALEIYKNTNRNPEPTEIPLWRGLKDKDSNTRNKIEATVQKGIELSFGYGLDLIKQDIEGWLSATLFVETVKNAAAQYQNHKNLEKSWDLIGKGLLKKQTSSFKEGVNLGFLPSIESMDLERQERIRQSKKALSYGVLFLDKCLKGILPNDLIVLGAKSGSGKTNMATTIALHNSQNGKRVHYFALEANQYEIERRIKYQILSNAYYQSGSNDYIDFGAWMFGELEDKLGALEKDLQPVFKESVKNLNVLYRTSGQFNLENLRNSLLKLVGKTDLIILDHLHYIDTDGEEENAVYKDCIMTIRDIVLKYEIPVIVVCHLRKTSASRGKERIVPTLEDFHGTSNIIKVATTAIMLGRAYDQQPSVPGHYLYPTYIKASKSRLDGSRTSFTGLMEFNNRTISYGDWFKVGREEEGGTEWKLLDKPVYWQK